MHRFRALIVWSVVAGAVVAGDLDDIRANAEAYVAAFNAADVDAAAGFWSEVATYRGPAGEIVRGRAAIREAYAELFAGGEPVGLEVDVQQLRKTAPSVAVEEGAARLTIGDEVRELTYKATHVRTADGWAIDKVDEYAADAGGEHRKELEPLAFLIGSWVDEGEGFRVSVSCNWSKNRHSLLRKFKVVEGGVLTLEGTQIVAWDAARGEIRSWLFDSEGGIGEGTWRGEADGRWVVTARQTQGDGARAAAVNVITPLEEGGYEWMSVERESDGRPLPPVGPITFRPVGGGD